ncbi:hypothetical protein [Actinoplanes sp. CA-252034]
MSEHHPFHQRSPHVAARVLSSAERRARTRRNEPVVVISGTTREASTT